MLSKNKIKLKNAKWSLEGSNSLFYLNAIIYYQHKQKLITTELMADLWLSNKKHV